MRREICERDSCTMVRKLVFFKEPLTTISVLMPIMRINMRVIACRNRPAASSKFAAEPARTYSDKRLFPGTARQWFSAIPSAKTSTTKVSTPVAIATPASPYKRIPTIVPSAEARILARLLPINTRLIRRSGLRSNFWSAFGRAITLFRHMSQTIAVEGHHSGFGPEK